MRKLIIVAGAIACAVLWSGEAEAANCATVSFSPTEDFAQTWDPMISPAAKTLTFTASFSNFAPATKSVRLIFLDNDSGSPIRVAASGPRYTITDGNSVTYGFNSAGLVESQPLIDTSGLTSKTFTVTIPANNSPVEDFVGGQSFSEAVRFTLQCVKNDGVSETGRNSLQTATTISITIPRQVSLTTASPQTINFGGFTTTTQTLQVGLKSTSSVNVTVATSNVNQMVLAGAQTPFPANSVIPYTMTLNGTSVANGTSLTNQTRAGVAGLNWPLILTLQNNQLPSGKLAGGYSDTITLTLTPGT